jgi:hypothetical protein
MLVGSDWKEYFDLLIVQARKPRFFTDVSRPIRVFDEQSGSHIWDRVTKLEKGVIYYEVKSKSDFFTFKHFFIVLGNCKTVARSNRMAWTSSLILWGSSL